MKKIEIQLEPLSRQAFAAYGDVIEVDGTRQISMNAGTFERYHDLAQVDVGAGDSGRTVLSIASCSEATILPTHISMVERHPLGSQAFIPMSDAPLITVVATPGETVDPNQLRAFVSNGRQGINYRPGVWHMPMIASAVGQQMLIVDRGGPGHNCDEIYFRDVEVILRH